MARTPHPHDHENTEHDETDEENGPIQEIFAIIDRYYKGLKREKEGMGVE